MTPEEYDERVALKSGAAPDLRVNFVEMMTSTLRAARDQVKVSRPKVKAGGGERIRFAVKLQLALGAEKAGLMQCVTKQTRNGVHKIKLGPLTERGEDLLSYLDAERQTAIDSLDESELKGSIEGPAWKLSQLAQEWQR